MTLKLFKLNLITNGSILNSTLIRTCLWSNYIIKLLSQYGINSFDNIKLVDDIDGKTVREVSTLC